MTLPPAGRVDISAALSSNAFFLGVDRVLNCIQI